MNKPRVLVCIPMRPTLARPLQERAYEQAGYLPELNPSLEICTVFDSRTMEAEPGDNRAWSKVARVRNRLLDDQAWHKFDYVLWIDADVVSYSPRLPTEFIHSHPLDISAPMVLVENTERFYDTCAFIIKGSSHLEPESFGEIPGRNLRHAGPPYWPSAPTERVVEMDCVGTLLLVPTAVYAHMTVPDLANHFHTNHPAFTDHFNVCAAARALGRKVLVHRNWVAYHADLPKYGEAWH